MISESPGKGPTEETGSNAPNIRLRAKQDRPPAFATRLPSQRRVNDHPEHHPGHPTHLVLSQPLSRAQRTATPGFERSETEHPPFAARLAFARPPRPRRRSKRRPRKREP
ncbi:hypothetical protein IFM12276_44920 [Nocardia sputorum]|uniref:Uncharacterized protein n=1 Tax=Nocardia sputorum TaxID=2984338 RepID=A0ABN6U8C6_9NOCA|nr:hypothetical protein IFM12276_44920 [Nocardia sputorum]